MYSKPTAAIAASLLLVLSVVAQPLQARVFGLDEVFSLAEQNSRQLRTSRSAEQVAEAAINEAKTAKLPDLNVSLSLSYLGNGFLTDRNFSNYRSIHIPHFGNDLSVEASQVIYAGGAVTSGIRLAEIGSRSAAVGTEESRRQVRFLLAADYLNLYKLRNQEQVYDRNISLTERTLTVLRARRTQGTALSSDLTRHELQLENLKLGKIQVGNERTILNHRLCTTLGLPEGTMIEPDTTLVAQAYRADGEGTWQADARTALPTLRLSDLNIERRAEELKLARAAKLPKIAAFAANKFGGPITIEVPPINKNLNYWYVGVGISYSLSSLYKGNKQIARAQLALQQSRDDRELAEQQAENDVQRSYTLFRQSFDELHTQEKSVQLAQENYRLVQNRYFNGLALVTDMTDAANVQLSAELQEVNARIGVVFAYYKMKYVSGKI